MERWAFGGAPWLWVPGDGLVELDLGGTAVAIVGREARIEFVFEVLMVAFTAGLMMATNGGRPP